MPPWGALATHIPIYGTRLELICIPSNIHGYASREAVLESEEDNSNCNCNNDGFYSNVSSKQFLECFTLSTVRSNAKSCIASKLIIILNCFVNVKAFL